LCTAVVAIHHVQKKGVHSILYILDQILANFQNSFTGTLSRKSAIKQSLSIQPYLKCIAAIPCGEELMSENQHVLWAVAVLLKAAVTRLMTHGWQTRN